MKNYAGRADVDAEIASELERAGIEIIRMPEFFRDRGEVPTIIVGHLLGWGFTRAWSYWVAKGPGLPPVYANELHASHGTVVRVAGHCGRPSPLEWYKGFAVGLYHIDTEDGLQALAAMLRRVVDDAAVAVPSLAYRRRHLMIR